MPIRTCPNPRCIHPRNPNIPLNSNGTTNGTTTGDGTTQPLELLPMEFDELDESRRVAALTEAASRRAKEKQRARKKAKLIESGGNAAGVSSTGGTPDGTGNLGIGISASASSTDGGGYPDDVSIDSQTRSMANHHPPQPDNQVSMTTSSTTTQPQAPPSSSSIVGADISSTSSAAATPTQTIGGISSELRTGRWTVEETHYCDTLVAKFMAGRLPLPDGIKLNEFLSNMLKSKQSRLTKKMKNAKLSSKTFRRTTGYLTSEIEAREYSEAEDAFFHSLQNQVERCEMRFHTRKEWSETFSTYCVSHGQMLNADAWLESIDEMDRRVHRAKDRMRMERRKMMMGTALRHDSTNPNRGVVIDTANDGPGGVNGGSGATSSSYNNGGGASSYSMTGGVGDHYQQQFQHEQEQQRSRARSLSFALPDGVGQAMTSPFLSRIINYIHRNNIPFEYVDAWVPSFVPDGESGDDTGSQEGGGESVASGQQSSNNSNANGEQKQSKCRLCFAGSIVAKQVIVGGEGTNQYRRAVPLTPDDQFNLAAFGDYSESFSFDVGCGLPGRVYHMGVPTWEQSVHNAPLHHFERVGGSQQWGIRTVVGIPVPSPNVGRVVIILYSRHDRQKDHDMVIRLTEEFTRLMPSPKWKLVVDVGQQPPPQQQAFPQQEQQQGVGGAEGQPSSEDSAALSSEVISIFGEHMPSDPKSPSFAYLQGFMSLRLLLLRQNRTVQEQDLVNTMLSSYSSYKAGGRTPADIALMLARDFMFLSEQQRQTVVPSPTNDLFSQPMQQQQPPVQNGMHLSASPPNGTSSMPPPSPHLPPKQEEQLTFTFQVDKGTGESGGISIVTGDSSGMLGDVAPTPISEMISAAAAAAVSAASTDGGLGLVDPSVASTMQ